MAKFDANVYNKDYKKAHYKQVHIMVPLIEKEVIEKLKEQQSVSKYIVQLIKDDIKDKKTIDRLKVQD